MNFFPTPVICLMLPLLVVGCSMQPGKDKLLPDGGDTTLELMQGVSARGACLLWQWCAGGLPWHPSGVGFCPE